MKAETVTAICSIVVAALALGVSIYQAYTNRKHNRQSVRPVLQFASRFRPGERAGVTLRNCGVGPAVIVRSELKLDDQPIGAFGEASVNRLRGPERPRPSAVTFETGAILASDYDEFLLSVAAFDPDRQDHKHFADLVRHRLNLLLEYDSLYGGERFSTRWPFSGASDAPGSAVRASGSDAGTLHS